jgi:hypothetical protein
MKTYFISFDDFDAYTDSAEVLSATGVVLNPISSDGEYTATLFDESKHRAVEEALNQLLSKGVLTWSEV